MANSTLNAYATFFSAWQANVVGPKPTAELLEKCHGLGLRPGKQALACALSLRDGGVTGSQIVIVCGAPQLNRMRGLISEGLFKRHAVAADPQGHTVYKNTVTPKGEAEIKRLAKVMANATASTKAPGAPHRASKMAIANAKHGVATMAKAANVSRKANAAAAPVVPPVAVAAPVAAGAMPDLPESLRRKPEATGKTA
jgi:hypothetical protein